MTFEDIAFQLVDLPPLSDQSVESWVFDLVRMQKDHVLAERDIVEIHT